MIASSTFATTLDCVSPGAGAGAPQVGISPASAVADRTQVKAIAINILLIDVSPFEV
jgi:hypothetical protein